MSQKEQGNPSMVPENNNQQEQEDHDQIQIEEDEHESDHNSQFSEDFNQDDEQQAGDKNLNGDHMQQQLKQISEVPKVKNPISAYGIFIKCWKQKNPNEKLSITGMAEIWNQMGKQEKQPYQKKFKQEKQKYQQYEAHMLSINPNFNKKQKGSGKDYYFPLHRVKAIMKLDNSYTTSTQNVCAMTKAVEYFGVYLLEQVKKASEGKKRIDLSSLLEAINNNQNNLWFLNCLIDEHTLQQNPVRVQKQVKANVNKMQEQAGMEEKAGKKQKMGVKSNNKKKVDLPKGQLKLTDMF